MSKYGLLETQIADQKYLIAALVTSGRKRRTSSYAGNSWIRLPTISASRGRPMGVTWPD